MAPKQRVLKKWPDAYCTVSRGGIAVVYPYPTHGYSNAITSSDRGPRQAWADAARRLERKRG